MAKRGCLSARDIPIEQISIAKIQQIFSNTIRVNQCRLRINPHHTGYSFVTIKGVKYPTHRLIKAVAMGIPNVDLVVDHLCRNKSCIRPSHLEFVTVGENVKRGTAWHHFLDKADAEYCVNGHSLKTALLSFRPSGTLRRACRMCHMLRERARREKIKARRSADAKI